MEYTTWLAKVKAERLARRWSLEEMGRQAAKVVGRTRPFKNSTMSRFERGEYRSREVITAVSILLGMGPPGAPVLEDEDMREWLRIGNELRAKAPVVFGRTMQRLSSLLALLEP